MLPSSPISTSLLSSSHLLSLTVLLPLIVAQSSQTTTFSTPSSSVTFADLTRSSGFSTPALSRARKYGGACLADLDGDGYLDLLLGNHNNESFLYFNKGDSSFSFVPSPWVLRADGHGMAAFRLRAGDAALHFAVTRGGFNAQRPNTAVLFRVGAKDRSVTPYEQGLLRHGQGRGRSILPVHLSADTRTPDFIFLNARMPAFTSEHIRVLSVSKVKPLQFSRRLSTTSAADGGEGDKQKGEILPALAEDTNHYAMVSDFRARENDLLDVFTFHKLRLYRRLRKDFRFVEVTDRALPSRWRRAFGVRALVELDYDNDGRWDIYVARSRTNDLKWISPRQHTLRDGLLRNVGGKYVDVTDSVGLGGLSSTGATAADFDNNGFVDILVTSEEGGVVLLRNDGEGGFVKEVVGSTEGPGGQPAAADLDRDGRVDAVLSTGDWFSDRFDQMGTYRLWRNVTPWNGADNFVLVRVKSAPGRQASSLHAVVTACAVGEGGASSSVAEFEEGECQRRRIGSPGVATSVSYVEVVHFGVGARTTMGSVSVRWVDGTTRTKTDVAVNRVVGFGV